MPSRSWLQSRQFAAVLIVVACSAGVGATLLTHEKADSPVDRADTGEVWNVETLVAELDCRHLFRLYDDLYNWAPTTGITCETGDGAFVVVRAFGSRRDADIALQDWPLALPGRSFLRGVKWFAVGPTADIDVIRSALPAGEDLDQRPPQPLALTDSEVRRTSCVRFLTNALHDYALIPEAYSRERADFNAIYPGLTELIEHEVDDSEIAELVEASQQDLELESVMSHIQAGLKPFCGSAVGPSEDLR